MEKDQNYRNKHYKRVHGISLEDVLKIGDKQNWLCDICQKPLPKKKGPGVDNWCLDHDHETGEIRAILCWNCNVGLGHFKENSQFLIAAAIYIMRFK